MCMCMCICMYSGGGLSFSYGIKLNVVAFQKYSPCSCMPLAFCCTSVATEGSPLVEHNLPHKCIPLPQFFFNVVAVIHHFHGWFPFLSPSSLFSLSLSLSIFRAKTSSWTWMTMASLSVPTTGQLRKLTAFLPTKPKVKKRAATSNACEKEWQLYSRAVFRA